MSAPRLSDGRVVVRLLEEKDVDAYLASFEEGDPLLNLLGFEQVPERDRLSRWFEHNWHEPSELEAWEFAVADAETDEFLGTLMLHSLELAAQAR